jgi:NADH dehydrogenase [ubiquinone] 1 alpha subcomplex assembly factor 7
MASSIEAVYMVEASPALRETQKKLLCGDAPMTETSIGYQSISKYANIPIIWTENIRFVPSGQPFPCQPSTITDAQIRY